MPIVDDPKLYEAVKKYAETKYAKHSAYRSGFIVAEYKRRGGTYTDDDQPKKLREWFNSGWVDIGGKQYPVYRPTKRISKHTPLTVQEIDPQNLKDQIKLKQQIKGTKNLPPFKPK
jgi:hypothetical protein